MNDLDWPYVLLGVAVSGLVIALGREVRRRIDQRSDGDPTLVIPPPRPYVDKDGRSDYRPELQERHIDRRY